MKWNPASIRTFLALSAALAGIFTQSSCGGGGSSAVTITSITITGPTTSGINVVSDFTAVVQLANATDSTTTTVTWQVDGTNGGTQASGTIVSSPTDNLVGEYTAPGIVPTTDGGVVTITATATQPSTSSTSTPATVTSNSVSVTITVVVGLNVSPATATVPAGGSHQFTAIQNQLPDDNAVWSLSSTDVGAGNPNNILGTIDSTGLYTAPLSPPPGGTVTITAQDGTVSATAVVTVTYSDASLYGPYAFSYAGGTGSGFMAVAGSFVADGNGNIVSGVEDINNFSTGTSFQIPIYSGNYVVSPDGRTNAVIKTARQTGVTWQFALTTNQHALMILFNSDSGGSGTIDQQNLNDLTAADSVLMACGSNVTCPYVIRVSGSDLKFKPFAMAGRFSVNGSGQIPQSGTILDVNDGGAVTTEDTSLNGSYSFDTAYDGTGRGVLTLTSATTGQIQYAFYVVDSTHLKLVEIDQNGYLAGDMFSAPTGNSFAVGELTAANYVFTAAGIASAGPYAAGGVFTSDGNGNVTGGASDSNSAGTVTSNTTLGACAYGIDATTGRIDLKLFAGSGTCPAGASSSLNEFAAYQTSTGPALLVEIDANAVASGTAYQQAILPVAPPVQAPVDGSFALNLGDLGVSKNSSASNPQGVDAQVTLSGTSVTGGDLDVNNFNAVYQNDPVSTSTSSITAPSSTLGRGTAVLSATNPAVSYSLVYYIIDNNTALLLDQDTVRVGAGIIARQF